MIHPLRDKMPTSVQVDGKVYPVVIDFRDWIAFFEMLDDEAYTAQERIICAMAWYRTRPPDNLAAAYQALLQFGSCSELPQTGRNGARRTGNPNIFSYRYDASCIIGDFLRYYQVDLTECRLHWYKFRMLLDALPDESVTKQRIAYRSIKLCDIKDKKRRASIRKIQDGIWIPSNKKLSAGQIGAAFG